ncbi:hypothetical protein SAMN05421642_13116 [Rhodococcoides kyotonense]|uniref:Uncharacterized protein n=1 Tax=Rhodococcoides kyotonense TaxID=398843 RepID=A0A239N9D6_9NOCA|nr:hypothetical protein SAMN05421642_13116 [Rhodococcus kyotonensis]
MKALLGLDRWMNAMPSLLFPDALHSHDDTASRTQHVNVSYTHFDRRTIR